MGSASNETMSAFSDLKILPLDPHYLLKEQYAADPSDKKILLGSGSYRDDDSRPWVLPSVAKAEQIVDKGQDSSRYEYLTIPGYAPFYTAARDLLLGKLGGNVDRVVSLHTLAGTGANFLGARFLKEALKPASVWLSDPTWVNHDNIWSQAGVPIKRYPYWNTAKRQLDFERMIQTLTDDAVAGDVIVLHACAHNPTGVDPSREQWKQIGDVCEKKKIFPFFDCAYHGFASGNLDRDAWAIQHFLSRGTMEVMVAQSFSKNMGLYGERVGALHLVTSSADAAFRAKGQLARLQRGQVSQPPNRGAKIATAILSSPSLFEEWLTDLGTICSRIQGVRERLYQELTRLGTPGTWEHIRTQIGMFSYSGLTPQQVLSLQKNSHVYIVGTGRISIASLSNSNVEYVARAIDAAVREHPSS